jgi:RND superfamily putative drug exporter
VPLLRRVGTLPHVDGVVSPYTPSGAVQVSRNRMTAFATVNYGQAATILDVSRKFA